MGLLGFTAEMLKQMSASEKERLLLCAVYTDGQKTDFDAIARETGSASGNSVRTMLNASRRKCEKKVGNAPDPDTNAKALEDSASNTEQASGIGKGKRKGTDGLVDTGYDVPGASPTKKPRCHPRKIKEESIVKPDSDEVPFDVMFPEA